MTDPDAALLEELRDMWTTYDPPPAGLVATMIAAVAAAEIDDEWEMLVLVRDSAREEAAQVRGLATARVLWFTAAQGWSLEAEIDGDEVRGQLLDLDGDVAAVEVRVETADGRSWSTTLDEVGFFALTAETSGSVRFSVRIGDATSTSRWVAV